jgi:probable HAF family extracellular repeat protein
LAVKPPVEGDDRTRPRFEEETDMQVATLTTVAGAALLAVLALPTHGVAQEPARYNVTDLGTLGGPFSIAYGLNSAGRVGGGATLADGSEHPFLWSRDEGMQDLGTLGGQNGAAAGPNASGQLALLSETATPDPMGEDFCGFGTHLTCLAAIWDKGAMTPLPNLGGNNGEAFGLNNRSQLIGISETATQDATCPSPQLLDFEAVIWGPKEGEVHQLRPLPGDTVGFALGLNDKGDVVGASGKCADTPIVPVPDGPHAVLWHNGSPTDLGNLGGKKSNVAAAVNDRGDVVGTSNLPGDAADPAFLWTRDKGMQNIGTVGADLSALPGGFGGINNKGQVVGQSCSGYLASGNCRAFLWEGKAMIDLNTLVPADSPLYLVVAFQIDDTGEIAGLGQTSSGDMHAFLATPLQGR